MRKYFKITPEGTDDVLFAQCIKQRAILDSLYKLYSQMGYNEIKTPTLEYLDVFGHDSFGMRDEMMYKLIDAQGRILVVRPDNTIPIARLFATRLRGAKQPVRLFCNQNVFNIGKSLRGQKNEFTQSGIELIGAGGKRADLEVIFTAVRALELTVQDFHLELGHAGFFRALAARLPVNDDIREDIRQNIEGKNYAALSVILDSIEKSPATELMRKLPRLFGGEEVFDNALEIASSLDESVTAPIIYLREIYRSLVKNGLDNKIMVDLGIVHRNDYYDGIIFGGYVSGMGNKILSGGRYDSLIERFGEKAPATGFAINVDEIVRLLASSSCGELSVPNILIHADDGYEFDALLHSKKLIEKNENIKIEYSDFNNREDALKYAEEMGINKVIFIGAETEMN